MSMGEHTESMVASEAGLEKLPANIAKAKLVDWEIASISLPTKGLPMAPAFAIPRLLARNGLTFADIGATSAAVARLPLPQHEQRRTRLGLPRSGCAPHSPIVPIREMGH